MTIIPRSAAVAATAAAALFALSFSAEAFPVTQQGSNAHNGYGAATVKLTGVSGNVSAGAFALNADELGGNFAAWCLDIANTLGLPSDYEFTTSPFAGNPLSASVISNLQALVNTAYSAVLANLNNSAYSAGFQLALWEIITETKKTYDVTKGNFVVSTVSGHTGAGNAARTKANEFLNGLGGPVTGNYTLTYLQSTDGKQSLVNIAPTPPVSEVPVPAAGLLLMGALGGLGVMARRRKSADA